MSDHPAATQPPAAEVRVLDRGGHALAFTWQVHGHGHLRASGQVAGAPNTPELAGWRYQAFIEAAQAAIAALRDLEAAERQPDAAPAAAAAAPLRARTCDFCAVAQAAWRYPTRGDRLATVLLGDALVIVPGGDWYACPTCHLLAEAGKWEALSERARLPADQGQALWATFRALRTGPALPLDRPEGRADG